MKKGIITVMVILLTSILFFFGCTEEVILYDLPTTYLKPDTVLIDSIKLGTYQSPPLMGALTDLYFGSEDGYINNFTLVRFSEWAQTGNIVHISALADSTNHIDSLVLTLTASDTVIATEVSFDLFYFPESEDSIFSEMSHYKNITESDVSSSVLIGSSSISQAEPDSTETINPILKFKIGDFLNVANELADTSANNNFTFLIKESTPLNKMVAFKSRESAILPQLTAYYRTEEDTLHSDFFSVQDVSIIEPAELSEDDKNFATVCRAKGLKSIVQLYYDTTIISREELLIQSAKLYLTANDIDSSNYRISSSALLDPVELMDFWIVEEDEYQIEGDITVDDTLKLDQFVPQIRSYLQSINNQDLENNGLKIYSNVNSDPFKSIHFKKNQASSDTLNSYLRVLYVIP
jgi:hypothetical protein